LLEPSFNLEVKLNVIFKIFEASYPMQNHVQPFTPHLFIQPFLEYDSLSIREDVASHIHHINLSTTDGIKYNLSVIDRCRVCASEGGAKNSAEVKGKSNANR
jgi:hypothetical protein